MNGPAAEQTALAPGFYEMKMRNATCGTDCRKTQYSVVFEERRVEDVRFEYPRRALEKVREVSEFNEALYRALVSPWIQATTTPWSAAFLKWVNSMHVSRYVFSDQINQWMAGVGPLAAVARGSRQPVADDNLFCFTERGGSQAAAESLDTLRRLRDRLVPVARFRKIFG